MPTSLRLPANIESQIAGFGSRTGLTKSAVIVRSIEEFLARHAEPSSLHIYEEAMRNMASQPDSHGDALARSPHKPQVLQSIRLKHAQRSARATSALATQKKTSPTTTTAR